MKKSQAPAIRQLLQGCPDGLLVAEILQRLPAISNPDALRTCLKNMPDAYIDRWVMLPRMHGQYSSVWCVVVPPANCPHPTERYAGTLETGRRLWYMYEVS